MRQNNTMDSRRGVAILLMTTFCVVAMFTSQALTSHRSPRCKIHGGCDEFHQPDRSPYDDEKQPDPSKKDLCNWIGCSNGDAPIPCRFWDYWFGWCAPGQTHRPDNYKRSNKLAEIPSDPDATPAEIPSDPDATQAEIPSDPDATQAEIPSDPDATMQRAATC